MTSIGISELLVIGAVCALFAIAVVAGIVVMIVVLGKRGRKSHSDGVPQFGGQNETV